MTPSSGPSQPLVVYADFSSPWDYLASRRVDALQTAGLAIEWRAVERHRRMPVRGLRLDARTRPEAVRELSGARSVLRPGEELPEVLPELVPRTEAAVSAYAEACEAGVADQVRRHLFAAYWEEHLDIGNPEVLRSLLASDFMRGHSASDPVRRFGYAVAMTRAPITTAAWRRIKQWQERWESLHTGRLTTCLEGSHVFSGEEACEHLADQADRHRRSPAAWPGSVVRVRRPLVTVRPPATWMTQVGDPWQRDSRMSGS